MKTIKLCEGHKGGYDFMRAFGMVEKVNIKLVPKEQCQECKAQKRKGGKKQ